jgi:hypothetical protein
MNEHDPFTFASTTQMGRITATAFALAQTTDLRLVGRAIHGCSFQHRYLADRVVRNSQECLDENTKQRR